MEARCLQSSSVHLLTCYSLLSFANELNYLQDSDEDKPPSSPVQQHEPEPPPPPPPQAPLKSPPQPVHHVSYNSPPQRPREHVVRTLHTPGKILAGQQPREGRLIHVYNYHGPRIIKLFSCSTQISMKF